MAIHCQSGLVIIKKSGGFVMSRVIHFEIGVDDPERAVRFYSEVFGWRIEKYDGPVDYWLASTGDKNLPGIDGALMKRPDAAFSTANTIDVRNLDEYLERVRKNGGKVLTENMAIPGVGYFAYCEDTEGNRIGVLQSDENAH
jgi:predicted enzyme related to lactoylglutathione lyase